MSSLSRTAPATTNEASVRRDIQGLRAIAVISVILFHAGLPVPGGFVGVDIFFVISGYVITAMLIRERARNGRINMRRFYIRRFKRLTPALATMTALTVIAALLFFSPNDQQVITGQTALGAMFIVANWVIALTTGGYFDPAAESNPLLHTWSLSVEEQFYIFFPWMLAIAWFVAARLRATSQRLSTGLALVMVIGIAVVSLAGTFYALRSVEISSGYLLGFYSTITRAWEFAAGALVALLAHRLVVRSKSIATILGTLGLLGIGASFFIVSGQTPWPGPMTLVPVTATMLVIVAGSFPSNAASRSIATQPFVYVGDRSYSLYLWHWPLIVLAVAIWPTWPWIGAIAAIACLVPSLLSYRFIEEPFRRSTFTSVRRALPAFVAVIGVPSLLAGGLLWTSKNILTPQFEAGMYSTVLDGGIDTVAYNAWVEVQSYPCQPKELFESAPTWKGFTRCRQSQPDGAVTVAIIGDSHAEHLFPGLAKALPNDNVAFYIDHSGRYYRDGDRMNQIFDYLETNSSIRTIVVSVNWFQKGVETEKMISALSPLTAQGRRIFVTDDNPTFAFGSFQCKYAQGLVLPKRCTMPADEFWPTHDRYAAKLREVASSLPGIQLVDTASFFCTRDVCDMSRDGAVIFRDINHLNELGTILVGQLIVSEHPDIATPQG